MRVFIKRPCPAVLTIQGGLARPCGSLLSTQVPQSPWSCASPPPRVMKAAPHPRPRPSPSAESTIHLRHPCGDGDLSKSPPKGQCQTRKSPVPRGEPKTNPSTVLLRGSWLPWTHGQVCKAACFQPEPEEGWMIRGLTHLQEHLKSEKWDVRRRRAAG